MTRKTGWVRAAIAVAVAIVAVACGAAQYEGRTLPRNVRSAVQRDFPGCGGRHVRGEHLGGGRFHVLSCGLNVVYQCRRGRWGGCQLEQQMVVATAQPQAAGTVVVMGTAPQGGLVITETQPAQQGQVVQAQPAQAQPVAPTPEDDPVAIAVRGWLDAQRATILGCTQTQAALIEATWSAQGAIAVQLGGEMHGTPGEQCVVQHLSGVQLQNVTTAGTVRHVIQ